MRAKTADVSTRPGPGRVGGAAAMPVMPLSRSNAADAHLSAGTAQEPIDTAIYFFQYIDELIICCYVH